MSLKWSGRFSSDATPGRHGKLFAIFPKQFETENGSIERTYTYELEQEREATVYMDYFDLDNEENVVQRGRIPVVVLLLGSRVVVHAIAGLNAKVTTGTSGGKTKKPKTDNVFTMDTDYGHRGTYQLDKDYGTFTFVPEARHEEKPSGCFIV